MGKTWGTVTGFLSFRLYSGGSLCGQRQGGGEEMRSGQHLGLSLAVQPDVRPACQISRLQVCAASFLHLPSLTAKLPPRYYFSVLLSVSPNGADIREPQ